MAALTVQNIVEAGLANALTAAAGGGDTFVNPEDQTTFLMVTNGGGGSINVTCTSQVTNAAVPGLGNVTMSDRVVAVPNGATRMIGPFPPRFNNASGAVAVSYSGVTSVTVGAFRLPKVA
ncbi:MAG: hypothetical protein ACRC7C_14430 [Beijerinckiaceae bacterium]